MSFKIYVDERNYLDQIPVRDSSGHEFVSFDPCWPIPRMHHVATLLLNERSIARSNAVEAIVASLNKKIEEYCQENGRHESDTGAFVFDNAHAETYFEALNDALEVVGAYIETQPTARN